MKDTSGKARAVALSPELAKPTRLGDGDLAQLCAAGTVQIFDPLKAASRRHFRYLTDVLLFGSLVS